MPVNRRSGSVREGKTIKRFTGIERSEHARNCVLTKPGAEAACYGRFIGREESRSGQLGSEPLLATDSMPPAVVSAEGKRARAVWSDGAWCEFSLGGAEHPRRRLWMPNANELR
jgi:hypothetical protein